MDDRDELRGRAHEAADEAAHSAIADKAKGRVKEAAGKLKEKLGSAIGDEALETRGAAQRLEGKKDRLKGEIKDRVDDIKGRIEAGVEVAKEKLEEARGGHKK